MKKITILLLHMQHGGIEKQTITFANQLANKYEVEIISVYSMKKIPAYSVDERVKIKYLIDDEPNRREFKSAIQRKNIIKIVKEAFKAIKILYLKKYLMINEIKRLNTDFVLSTRIEFAQMLSKYAPKGVITMTQEHLHNDSKKYINRLKRAFKNLNYLIVLGPGSYENYSKWLKDNKKIKIIQIPNILEHIPEKSSLLNNNKIISIGRLHPEKDFETLIEVFNIVKRKIPNVTLDIVGGGDEFDKLKQVVNRLKLEESVNITGMLSKEDVEKYLLNADIYVMTSIAECFPMVLLEASSCGLPLISFDVPVGPRAIIKNEENGFLIKDRNKDEMAKKIIELLDNKNELVKLGKKSKEMALNYVPDKVMKKWDNIFQN